MAFGEAKQIEQAAQSKSKWILVYDDLADSIQPICKFLRAHGFKVEEFTTITAFADRLLKLRELGEVVYFVVLDMHDERVQNLAELDQPKKGTIKGNAVGLALAQHFIWDKTENLGMLPVLLYSAVDIPEVANQTIKEHVSNGKPLEFAGKSDDVPSIYRRMRKFDAVDYSLVDPTDEELKVAFEDTVSQSLAWGFTGYQVIKLLGRDPQCTSSVNEALSTLLFKSNNDDKLRLGLIVDIRTVLNEVFGPDADAQSAWMQKQRFGNYSPCELMGSGNIEDLLMVANFMRDRVM